MVEDTNRRCAVTLSVVVTTYNRASILSKLIAAFEAQTERDFELIVAIDGSTDETETVLADLSPSFTLDWFNTHCRGYGLALARNSGILAAKGHAVVIIDDDSMPEPNFVAAHLASVRPGVMTGGPRWPRNVEASHMVWRANELDKLPNLTPLSIQRMRRAWPNAYLVENNICLLRDDWISIGLFSERLKIYGYIGQEFFARAEYLGYQFQYQRDAAIYHYGELEGDNGFSRRKKERDKMISNIFRPSLLKPKHFEQQIAWAKARANSEELPDMSPFVPHALGMIPVRVGRKALRKFSLLKEPQG